MARLSRRRVRHPHGGRDRPAEGRRRSPPASSRRSNGPIDTADRAGPRLGERRRRRAAPTAHRTPRQPDPQRRLRDVQRQAVRQGPVPDVRGGERDRRGRRRPAARGPARRRRARRAAAPLPADRRPADRRDHVASRRWSAGSIPSAASCCPAAFIAIAEETGAIVEIGAWVLETACAELRTWQADDARPRPGGQRVRPSAPGRRARRRRPCGRSDDPGVEPSSLILEVTETILVADPRAEAMLRQLKALGVRLAIDDFGTGYSSISYLRRFPIDILKIDREFTKRDRDARGRGPVRRDRPARPLTGSGDRRRRHRTAGPARPRDRVDVRPGPGLPVRPTPGRGGDPLMGSGPVRAGRARRRCRYGGPPTKARRSSPCRRRTAASLARRRIPGWVAGRRQIGRPCEMVRCRWT